MLSQLQVAFLNVLVAKPTKIHNFTTLTSERLYSLLQTSSKTKEHEALQLKQPPAKHTLNLYYSLHEPEPYGSQTTEDSILHQEQYFDKGAM